jgi:hypothetical protein
MPVERPIHWEVRITDPPAEEGKWAKNINLDVITYTAQRAIELTVQQYPNAVIHVVYQRSHTNLLFDPEIFKSQEAYE